MSEHDELLREIVSTFVGPPRPRDRDRRRSKPHRCIDCGRVTRHVRCHDCSGASACTVCRWVRP